MWSKFLRKIKKSSKGISVNPVLAVLTCLIFLPLDLSLFSSQTTENVFFIYLMKPKPHHLSDNLTVWSPELHSLSVSEC